MPNLNCCNSNLFLQQIDLKESNKKKNQIKIHNNPIFFEQYINKKLKKQTEF